MNKISVVLIVRNEENKIRDCLKRITWANETLVIDQASTDATVAIAKEFTDKVHVMTTHGVCETHRMFSLNLCSHEWVMFLDRENRELKAKLLELENRLSQVEENTEKKEERVRDFSFLNV